MPNISSRKWKLMIGEWTVLNMHSESGKRVTDPLKAVTATLTKSTDAGTQRIWAVIKPDDKFSYHQR